MRYESVLPREPPRQCRNIAEPDPDIAGLGVMISFVSSGILTLLLSIIYYFLFYNPLDEASLQTSAGLHAAAIPNPVDARILSFRPRLNVWLHQRWPNEIRVLERGIAHAIRSLSDLQIVLGLCILIAGFIRLDLIAAFYWQILVYIAWFSNLSHQCALIVLRRDFSTNEITRNWRLFLMTSFLALLLAAVAPTMYFNWDFSPDSRTETRPLAPVLCFFMSDLRSSIYSMDRASWGSISLAESTAFFSTTFSLSFLVISYGTRLVKISPLASTLYQDKFAAVCSLAVRRVLATSIYLFDVLTLYKLNASFWFFLVESPIVAVYLSLRILSVFVTSSFFDLISICFGCAWALFRIINQKNLEVLVVRETPDALRSIWSFGQLLPIVLLLNTVFSLLRSFKTAVEKVEGESKHSVASGIEQPAPLSSATRLNVQNRALKPLLALNDKRRWARLQYLLHKDHHLERHWLSPILVNIGTGVLSALAAMMISLMVITSAKSTVSDLSTFVARMNFIQPISLLAMLFWLSVLFCVSAAGGSQKPSRTLYWKFNYAIAGYYVAFLTADLFTGVIFGHLSGMAAMIVLFLGSIGAPVFCILTYFFVFFIRCAAPQNWGWRPTPPYDAVEQPRARASMEMQDVAVSDTC